MPLLLHNVIIGNMCATSTINNDRNNNTNNNNDNSIAAAINVNHAIIVGMLGVARVRVTIATNINTTAAKVCTNAAGTVITHT